MDKNSLVLYILYLFDTYCLDQQKASWAKIMNVYHLVNKNRYLLKYLVDLGSISGKKIAKCYHVPKGEFDNDVKENYTTNSLDFKILYSKARDLKVAAYY